MFILVLTLLLSVLLFSFYAVARDPKKIAKDAAWVRKMLGIR